MSLRVRELRFYRDRRVILDGLSFSTDPGGIAVVLGPNGAGKTTLLRCLAAIHRPRSGAVLLEDEDILGLSPGARARRTGYVPQRVEAGRMTVFEAVLLGRKPHVRFTAGPNDLRKVEAALESLGLADLAARRLDELSGGELQKTALARALVQEPKLLILDEPTSSLDLKNQAEILLLLKRAAREHAVSLVVAMHDLNAALSFADQVLFLKDGRIRSCGPVKDVTARLIEDVYGAPVDLYRLDGRTMVLPSRPREARA